VLVFLWAIANGMGTEVSLADPPEVPITDAMMQQIHQELMGTPAPTPVTTGAPTMVGGSESLLMPALIQNMNAMAGHALRVAQREEKKSSMISRLSEEQSDLFTLLSAHDWRDHHPRPLSAFASQLLSDKDPWKAHSLITS
jgi:hypothetical protein